MAPEEKLQLQRYVLACTLKARDWLKKAAEAQQELNPKKPNLELVKKDDE